MSIAAVFRREELLTPARGGAVLLALLAVTGGTASAGRLRKVWEFNVGTVARSGNRPAVSPLHVFAVSFSPDGRRVATVVGESMEQESLVLVDATNPGANGARYEVRPPFGGDSEFAPGPGISWSISGDAIRLISILHTSDGKTCTLPSAQFFFFGANSLAGLDFSANLARHQAGNAPWHLLLSNADCQDAGTWEIPSGRYISDASADRGLLCIMPHDYPVGPKPEQPGVLEVLVVSPPDRNIVHQWNIHALNLGLLFADSGKALCGLDGTDKRGIARCWSVDSGKEIALTTGLNVHEPIRTALHAQRAVLSDYGWGINFEAFEAKTGALTKRVIWDFGTGQELASWKPKWQAKWQVVRSAPAQAESYKFAISPEGDHVIEGGDGVLVLYEIEP